MLDTGIDHNLIWGLKEFSIWAIRQEQLCRCISQLSLQERTYHSVQLPGTSCASGIYSSIWAEVKLSPWSSPNHGWECGGTGADYFCLKQDSSTGNLFAAFPHWPGQDFLSIALQSEALLTQSCYHLLFHAQVADVHHSVKAFPANSCSFPCVS